MRSTVVRLLLLARPGALPLAAGLPLLGFWFGMWDAGLFAVLDFYAMDLLLLAVAWALLSAGSLWLNAALDRDEGQVLLGRAVTVPRAAGPAGVAALGAAVAAALPVGPTTAACAAGCALLAVLYSHERTAWKGHPFFGPAVNLIGYGVLSPIGGWAVAGVDATPRAAGALALTAAWVGAIYFAAMAFQRSEDARRGYRTLVVTHGPVAAIGAARACNAAAALALAVTAGAGAFPRASLVAVPAFLWADRALARAMREPGGGGEPAARTLLGRLVLGGLCLLLAVLGDHAVRLVTLLPL
jgi:1,4-dihydroxy-2-naphthoate octaprenyltransferase